MRRRNGVDALESKTKRKCWQEFIKKYPQPELGMIDKEVESMIDYAFEVGNTIKEKK